MPRRPCCHRHQEFAALTGLAPSPARTGPGQGAQPFDRGKKDVEPTELGRLFIEHAAQVEGAVPDLRREFAKAQGLESGELIVAPRDESPERLRSREIDLMVTELRGIRALEEFDTLDLASHPARIVCRDSVFRIARPPNAR